MRHVLSVAEAREPRCFCFQSRRKDSQVEEERAKRGPFCLPIAFRNSLLVIPSRRSKTWAKIYPDPNHVNGSDPVIWHFIIECVFVRRKVFPGGFINGGTRNLSSSEYLLQTDKP